MTTTPVPAATETVILAPSYRLPIAIVGLAIALAFIPGQVVSWWIAGVVGLFGLFLIVQAATLRLWFTDTALDIYRGETLIRQFPYTDWQHWEIYWSAVPILFYFKEVKSIHFVPVLFDPKMLRTCLEQRCPMSS
jgi:hypothetical protein